MRMLSIMEAVHRQLDALVDIGKAVARVDASHLMIPVEEAMQTAASAISEAQGQPE